MLDERLEDREFVAGDYSIADMACYPWIVLHERQGQDLTIFPSQALVRRIQKRPAVQRAYELAKSINVGSAGMTEEGKKILFGQGRRQRSQEK